LWLPLQYRYGDHVYLLLSLYMYLLLAQMDNNNNDVNAHFVYVHHMNSRYCTVLVWIMLML
jgi:hypothetical protein